MWGTFSPVQAYKSAPGLQISFHKWKTQNGNLQKPVTYRCRIASLSSQNSGVLPCKSRETLFRPLSMANPKLSSRGARFRLCTVWKTKVRRATQSLRARLASPCCEKPPFTSRAQQLQAKKPACGGEGVVSYLDADTLDGFGDGSQRFTIERTVRADIVTSGCNSSHPLTAGATATAPELASVRISGAKLCQNLLNIGSPFFPF